MDPTACERATQHASQPSVTDGQAKAERKKVTWLCPHKSSEKRTWGFSNLNDSVGFCIAPSSIQALGLFFFIRPLRTCFIWNNPESHGRHEAENWLVEGISNQWIQVWKLPPESSSPSLAVTGTRVINHLNPGRFTKYPLCCIRQQRDCRATHHSLSPMHNFLEPTLLQCNLLFAAPQPHASAKQNATPHHDACNCLCLFLPAPGGKEKPFPSTRCYLNINKCKCQHWYDADTWADFFLHGWAERCWQQLPLVLVTSTIED